jgi:hypothetical protein
MSIQSRRNLSSEKTWLLTIGQGLRIEYDDVDPPIPERLAALLKKLKEEDAKVDSSSPAPLRR